MDGIVWRGENLGLVSNIIMFVAYWLAVSIQIFEGYRNKLPLFKWIVLVAVVNFSFLLGCKFFSFSKADWIQMFSLGQLLLTNEKTALGGLVFAGLTLLALVWLFKFGKIAFDAFAISTPVGLAIQKVSCLLVGCCFGEPTNLLFGIRYTRGTLPYNKHLIDDIIQFGDSASHKIHPVQAYEIIGLFLIVLILISLRKRIRIMGNLLILSMALISALKFLVLFFRDRAANAISDYEVLGVSSVQLGTMAVSLMLIFIFCLRGGLKSTLNYQEKNNDGLLSPIMVFCIFVLAISYYRNWLNFDEYIIAISLCVPIFILFTKVLFQQFNEKHYSTKLIGIFIVLVAIMGQTVPGEQKDSVKTHHSVKLGNGFGQFENKALYKSYVAPSECQDGGMVTNAKDFEQKYNFYGAGYSYTRYNYADNIKTHFNLATSFGSNSETGIVNGPHNSDYYAFVTPGIDLDFNAIGIGFGFSAGKIPVPVGKEIINSIPTTAIKKAVITPSFNFRLGRSNIFCLKYHYYNNFPASYPGFNHKLEIGSGFGLKNDFAFQLGTNLHDPYVSLYIPIQNRVVIESMYLWKGRLRQSRLQHFNIGLHYRFGHKTVALNQEKQ